jgi:hypothetical protein
MGCIVDTTSGHEAMAATSPQRCRNNVMMNPSKSDHHETQEAKPMRNRSDFAVIVNSQHPTLQTNQTARR